MARINFALLSVIGSVLLQASCLDLVNAYPDFLCACKDNNLIWRDGTKMRYDDGKKKTPQEMLNSADLSDMFIYRYPVGAEGYGKAPAKNFDPGRIRYEPFFRKMYGNSAVEVENRLRLIPWIPKSTGGKYHVRITTVNGVDVALCRVSNDLDKLLKKHPEYLEYLIPLGGTFNWRKIAGTKRLSVHSFGAAIDINVKHSTYWKWNSKDKKYHYSNEIPLAIVKIFEKHGFIWGGKWYHYDTMHFEYRPELLLK